MNQGEKEKEKAEEGVRVECHMFDKNTFCSGAAFVPREGGVEEDDGWIIAFVHNEDTIISEVGWYYSVAYDGCCWVLHIY